MKQSHFTNIFWLFCGGRLLDVKISKKSISRPRRPSTGKSACNCYKDNFHIRIYGIIIPMLDHVDL